MTRQKLPPHRTMLRAFFRKDARFNGLFYAGIKTTGVFCRPICRAKPAHARNVEFFPTARHALYQGYRPCKLCRPMDNEQQTPIVKRLLQLVEDSHGEPVRGHTLRALSIDPSTARRQFRGYCNMTFAAYQRARRVGIALSDVRNGRRVIEAQIDAGYESASGFREAVNRLLGASPRDSRNAAIMVSKWLPTPLGAMLAVALDDGIVLFDFADRKGLQRAILRMQRRFGSTETPAAIVPGEHPHLQQLQRELEQYFAGTRREFAVPLKPPGTPFESRAWTYLRSIPYGRTRTYRQEAVALGSPAALRAVGRANGANYISILIPCHRVIASNGELCGYGGGVARKRWLLEHERENAAKTLLTRCG